MHLILRVVVVVVVVVVPLQFQGASPLGVAAREGHTEIVQVLLQAPDINVNQADVSIYLLTLSPVVVGG